MMITRFATFTIAASLIMSGSAIAADINQRFEDAFTPVEESTNSSILSLWLGPVFLQTTDGDFGEDVIGAIGGDARHHFEMAPGWGLQVELAAVVQSNADATDSDPASYHVIAGLHAINRTANGAWGLFAAGTHTQANDTGNENQHILGGIEAAWFSGMNQYNFQVGGHTVVGGDSSDTWDQGIFGTASFRHFYTENSAVRASGALGGGGDFEGNQEAVWGQWIVDYEHQLAGTALSLFTAYQGDLLKEIGDDDWGDNMINHTIKLGLKGTFGGGGTIYSVAHSGAGTFSLPDLHMPFSFTDDLW